MRGLNDKNELYNLKQLVPLQSHKSDFKNTRKTFRTFGFIIHGLGRLILIGAF